MRLCIVMLLVSGLAAAAEPKKEQVAGPAEDKEPPQIFFLESGGKKLPVELDKPFKAADLGGDTATLRVEPHRVFSYAGLSFHYPRQYAFNATTQPPVLSMWTLSGTDCVIMVHRYKGEQDHAEVRRKYLDGMAKRFKEGGKYKESEAALELKGTALKGTALELAVADELVRQEVYAFKSGGDSVVFILQNSPRKGGTPSDERVQAGRMLKETFRLPK
jgi:hypothetical protein